MEHEVKKYICSMHSEVVMDAPGVCPKCGMELVEVAPSSEMEMHRMRPATDNTKIVPVKPYLFGVLAVLTLLIFYLVILTLVSGFSFTMEQFSSYWYYIVPLAIGFGIQIGLFSYIRQIHKKMSAGMVTATGTTSTLSMISCCAHYLVNLLPILGVTGIITLISTYQIQLFWVGLLFNLAGIIYMASKVYKIRKERG